MVLIEDMLKKSPNISKDLQGKNLGKDMEVLWTNLGERADSEIEAHQVEKKCLIASKVPPNAGGGFFSVKMLEKSSAG